MYLKITFPHLFALLLLACCIAYTGCSHSSLHTPVVEAPVAKVDAPVAKVDAPVAKVDAPVAVKAKDSESFSWARIGKCLGDFLDWIWKGLTSANDWIEGLVQKLFFSSK